MSLAKLPAPSETVAAALSAAKPGDVVLITPCDPPISIINPKPPLAKLIRDATRAPVSHSLVVVDDARFVDIRKSRSRKDRVAISDLSTLLSMRTLKGCWLLRHSAWKEASDPQGAHFQRNVVASTTRFLDTSEPVDFATRELVLGLLLLLARADGPKVIKELHLRDALRKLLDASPTRMFCSELVYRVFSNAVTTTGKQEYEIDCREMLLKDWYAVLRDGSIEGRSRRLVVEAGSPIARLAAQGRLAQLGWEIEVSDLLDGPEADPPTDPVLDDDVASLLTMLGKASVEGWQVEVADFVTPRDLMYSPSFEPIARWGLGLGQSLDPWWCT